MIIIRTGCLVSILLLVIGCGSSAPEIEWLRANPDSIPPSGVAYLQVRARDPGRSELSYHWEAQQGTVLPDTGDSTIYYAPPADTDDTVRVVVRSERGLTSEGSVIIHVREGLCGGRPEAMISTEANLLVADSAAVYYVEPAEGRWEIRRISTDLSERSTIATRGHELHRLAHYGGSLYWLERDASGSEPYINLMAVGKTDTAPPVLIRRFSGRYEPAIDIAASSDQVHVAWLETVDDTMYVARITSYPRRGGSGQERYAFAGPKSAGTMVSRLAAAGNELFFLVISGEPDQVAVMRLSGTGAAEQLVGPDLLSPGTLAVGDGIAVAGEDVFWSERVQGRVGRVGRDGTGPEFIVPAGADAREVNLLMAVDGPGNSGPRLVWTIPGNMHGMIVAGRAVIRNLSRNTGEVRALGNNQHYLFYVQSNGTSRMYRLLMP